VSEPLLLAFNEVTHQRHRLSILATLAEADRADFPYLKRTLSLTDGNLGRHLEILSDAEMITLIKGYEGKRPRTWAKITPAGRRALHDELTQMRQLIARLDPPTTSASGTTAPA
jgi:DNA-binding MarR family transcriptional regulator